MLAEVRVDGKGGTGERQQELSSPCGQNAMKKLFGQGIDLTQGGKGTNSKDLIIIQRAPYDVPVPTPGSVHCHIFCKNGARKLIGSI